MRLQSIEEDRKIANRRREPFYCSINFLYISIAKRAQAFPGLSVIRYSTILCSAKYDICVAAVVIVSSQQTINSVRRPPNE